MSRPSDKYRVEIGSGPETARLQTETDAATRVLVAGDFSGKAARKRAGKPVPIDRDNFDEVMALLVPDLRLPDPVTGGELVLQFHEMEDFHPDRLLERCEWFHLPETPAPQRPGKAAAAGAPPPAGTGNLLEDMLDGRRTDPLREWLGHVVAPYLVESDEARAAAMAPMRELQSQMMRALLHLPAFQALEAAWLGLFFLIRHAGSDEECKVYLMDTTQDDLAAHLTALAGRRWDVVAASFSYDAGSAEDLSAATAAAHELDGVLVAGITGKTFPARPRGSCLGTPRFLLRLPYGKEGATVETLPFEEFPEGPEPAHLLWGSAAFPLACLLVGETEGRAMDFTDMPAFVYRADGEPALLPCTEHVLKPAQAEDLLASGMSVLLSYANDSRMRAVLAAN